MKAIGIVLIICLILTYLIKNEIVPSVVSYVVLVLFALLVFYTIYHVYLKTPNRSRRQWDKYYFKQPDLESKTDSSKVDANFDYDKFDKKIDGEFDKYLDTCKSNQ